MIEFMIGCAIGAVMIVAYRIGYRKGYSAGFGKYHYFKIRSTQTKCPECETPYKARIPCEEGCMGVPK